MTVFLSYMRFSFSLRPKELLRQGAHCPGNQGKSGNLKGCPNTGFSLDRLDMGGQV